MSIQRVNVMVVVVVVVAHAWVRVVRVLLFEECLRMVRVRVRVLVRGGEIVKAVGVLIRIR